MKTHIKDAMQVFAAVIITGSMIASAAPLPTTPLEASITPEVTAKVETPTPVTTVKQVETTSVEVVPTTWQDNPNKCNQETQYIAQEAPFNCIDKPVATPVATAPVERTYTAGSCSDWLQQAGVTDIASAMELIRKESNCNPTARNVSSGACGVAQELPCGKSGCYFGDGACQVKWMNSYVISRYGSWSAALSFHIANGWY